MAGQSPNRFQKTNFAYFNLLAESFLSRKYDLIHPPANPFDLSLYQGAVYLPWGPLPAIILMPAVRIGGIEISDRVYTPLFGAINVTLVFLILVLIGRMFPKFHLQEAIILTIFYAIGTVNFSVSTVGQVWFTSQVMTLTIFLFSLYALFKYFISRHWFWLSVALIFWLISITGRLWYVMFTPLYLGSFFYFPQEQKERTFIIISFLLSALIMVRFYGVYNLRRFGSLFETGYTYQRQANNFIKIEKDYGKYNSFFLAKNVWYEFIKPLLPPRFKPDPMGNGLLATSPVFILLFFFWKKTMNKKIFFLLLSGVVSYTIPVMLFFGTGYVQFGHRYLLEIIPLLVFMTALCISSISRKLLYVLVICSILIHSWGAYWLIMRT